MWPDGGKTPVSVYARSTDKVLGSLGTKDSTFGLFTHGRRHIIFNEIFAGHYRRFGPGSGFTVWRLASLVKKRCVIDVGRHPS